MAQRDGARLDAPAPEQQRCPPFGAADERGAANLQTAESVLRAARLIRDGKTYELGKGSTAPFRCRRAGLLRSTSAHSGPNGATHGRQRETVFTELGRWARSSTARAPAARTASLQLRGSRKGRQARRIHETRGREAGSFFARGVLLDIAALKGVDMLPTTT